jgi:rubrerythrin
MAYIDRQKLIEHIEADIQECGEPDTNARPVTYGTILGLKGALSFAQTLPSADVAEVKHGECVIDRAEHIVPAGRKNSTKHISYKCSECGRKFGNNKYLNYCPNCGAKMDGGKI